MNPRKYMISRMSSSSSSSSLLVQLSFNLLFLVATIGLLEERGVKAIRLLRLDDDQPYRYMKALSEWPRTETLVNASYSEPQNILLSEGSSRQQQQQQQQASQQRSSRRVSKRSHRTNLAMNLPESLMLQSSNRIGEAEVETFYIRKGANGTLPCLPVSSADNQDTMSKIEWLKEDKRLLEAEAKRIVVWNAKNSIAYLPETGALLFRGVSNEDSGEYHCMLTKPNSGEIEDGIVRFYVQDVPDPPQMPVVTGFTQRSLNLSWVPSFDFHHSPILHYIIHVREGEKGEWDVSNGVMTPDNRTQFEIIGLKPFTTYSFRVLAVNAIGASEPSPASYFIKTLRQKPDSRVDIISARNVSSNAIKLEWLRPAQTEIHGEFLNYRIRYVHQLPEPAPPPSSSSGSSSSNNWLNESNSIFGSFVSSGQDSTTGYMISSNQRRNNQPHSANKIEQPSLDGPLAKEIIVGDPAQTSFVVKNLNTYTLYKFSVQVSNPAGDGPMAEVLAMTDEGVPSPPLDVKIIRVTDTSVKLRWSEPRSPNGILQGYQIILHDISGNLNDTRKLSDPQSIMEHTLGELNPLTWYTVSIQAFSNKFIGDSSSPLKFRTDLSAPSAPQSVNVTCFTQDTILVQWLRPEKFYEKIDFYYVQYKPDSNSLHEEKKMLAKRDKIHNELFITNLTAGLLYELKVIAGTRSILDQNLVYKSETTPTLRVLLRPNCESYTAYPLTENSFNISLAIGVVCASFALALVTASLIVWRRHCQAAYYYLDDPQTGSRGTNSPQLSETYDDSEYGSLPVNEWGKHVQKLHADGDIGFSREFEQIQQAKNSNLTCEHSQMAENKHKNRYINIVAYDHTRVTLRILPGQKKPGADYINANYIDGYNKPRAYIGTQGPLVSTFDDYWRMIWEQKVVIIVMITNLQERGRRKCDLYWPKEGAETYGHIQVKLLQEVVMATYTLRTFVAKNLKLKKRSDSERTVYQYHYTNWPDHGVPDHPLPVLSFIRKSASANPPGAGPIICHCSAGCGRSGTYIVIDAMLKQIRLRRSVNVVDFLKHIRNQRNYLVQTEEQYIFIHDALVEAIESGETEIASNFIAKYIQLLQTAPTANHASNNNSLILSQKNSSYSIANGVKSPVATVNQQALSVSMEGNQLVNSQSNLLLINPVYGNTNTSGRNQVNGPGQWSLLERQYRLVASFKAKDFNVVSALKPCNKNKNRTLNLIPLEAHRVHITAKPGQEGSDYINATFLMGFNHLREFIVTQHPVNETFSDFWQMVYDHNSQTIVLLTQMNDLKEFPQFWPQKEDEVDYGSFKVKLTQESTIMKGESGGLIITRDFIMRSNQDDYELQTRVIQCPGWPECCSPLSGVFDLIQIVQNATQQQASQQKMHDGNNKTTTVTIGQEHEPQNGGPIIVVDKYGGTEAATFAVLTTLFKQINFEDAVDVYMYAKLAHLRRPGIWSTQDDYLFLYRAVENYASRLSENSANNQYATLTPTNHSLSHGQTMTLDRHKHKSSNSLKTSTMHRKSHNTNARQNQISFPELTGKNLNQSSNDNSFKQQQQQAIAHPLDEVHVGPVPITNITHPSNAAIMIQRNAVTQQLKASLQNNNSPLNSATSIGANSHQHLLTSNGRTVSSNQTQPSNHYLYPMS